MLYKIIIIINNSNVIYYYFNVFTFHIISTNALGCWNVVATGLTISAYLGKIGYLLVEICFLFLFASVFFLSFSWTLLTNSSLHFDGLKWSALTWNLFSTYLPLTLLCNETPIPLGFTLKTFAVLPWEY